MKSLIVFLSSGVAGVLAFLFSKDAIYDKLSFGSKAELAISEGLNWNEVGVYAGAALAGVIAFALVSFLLNILLKPFFRN